MGGSTFRRARLPSLPADSLATPGDREDRRGDRLDRRSEHTPDAGADRRSPSPDGGGRARDRGGSLSVLQDAALDGVLDDDDFLGRHEDEDRQRREDDDDDELLRRQDEERRSLESWSSWTTSSSSRSSTSSGAMSRELLSARQRFGSRWTSSGSSSWCSGLSSARSSLGAMAPGTSSMMRARRRDVSVKPNRRLDRSSTRGMIYENEELRLRTINISAEVERSQDDVKKLRRENDQLRRELWGLRDEYDKLEALLKEKEQGGESEEYSDEEDAEDVEGEEEEAEEEGDEDQDGDGDDGDQGAEEGKPSPQDGSAAAAPAAQGAAAYRERQVDFDMLSVVQEETENDQTDSLTGGEDQSVSPVIPRKKGVCFLLEPLPENQAPEQAAQAAQAAPEQPMHLVCDQYLLGADGKPLRGPAGKFATTADLAQDPFQYPDAYGYATGTVVGGVLIPAVDPATGMPFTGLFQPPADVYLDASGDAARVNGEAALGFDGLLLAGDAAAMGPADRASSASPLWTQQDGGDSSKPARKICEKSP
ncbi:protein bfr2 [Thrips palmi]|uniref:Protein bfr2 n=1 Tax=Thrips palmi TaxID=161013 RepID=A0A6P9A8E8_THRPL|nr:protein bfr2 [Thrips palmi]